MELRQRYIGQSLVRVQQFLDRHADVVGVVNGTPARRQLNTAVAALQTTVNEQGTQTREALGETSHQRQLEGVLRKRYMTPIAKFARANLPGVPNFAALTPTAGSIRGAALADAARAMGAAAAPYTSDFTAAQFPSDFVAQLDAAADAVTASVNTRASKRVQRVGATTQMVTILRSGRAAVLTLDAAITQFIAGDARLMDEWRVARRVVDKPGGVAAPAPTEPTSVAPPVAKAA